MILDLNVNKQRKQYNTRLTHFTKIVYLKQRQEDMLELSFQKSKSLSGYAGLSGYLPTRNFTHNWTFIKHMPT